MTKLEELEKAISEAAESGVTMLRKSQMSLDFSAPNPHHVAYTRTNASGTVSNIQAKGAPKPNALTHKIGDTVQHVMTNGEGKTIKYGSHDKFAKELGEIHDHLFSQGYQPYRHPGKTSGGEIVAEPGVRWSQKQYRKGLHYINVRHTGRVSRGESEITITRHNI